MSHIHSSCPAPVRNRRTGQILHSTVSKVTPKPSPFKWWGSSHAVVLGKPLETPMTHREPPGRSRCCSAVPGHWLQHLLDGRVPHPPGFPTSRCVLAARCPGETGSLPSTRSLSFRGTAWSDDSNKRPSVTVPMNGRHGGGLCCLDQGGEACWGEGGAQGEAWSDRRWAVTPRLSLRPPSEETWAVRTPAGCFLST